MYMVAVGSLWALGGEEVLDLEVRLYVELEASTNSRKKDMVCWIRAKSPLFVISSGTEIAL